MATPSEPGSGEAELRELVITVLERIDRDGDGALDEACLRHPALAQRLRERVGALQGLGLIGADAPLDRVGDFKLLERIGAGGMGVVYRAEQLSLGREVALKLIRPEILGVARARERFERETAIVARLQHPGIVPIYTVGRDVDRPYYAMELVRGCTLEQALAEFAGRRPGELCGADLRQAVIARSRHAASEDQGDGELFEGTWEHCCLRITAHVSRALDHAHRRGVLHRDVKPGNVLITPGGRVMLVDFGLSQADGDDSLTRSGERVGSVHFMSPELLRRGVGQMDARSDVYSLGVTLYRLLALAYPFVGSNEVAIMHEIMEGRPRPPREHLPGISWECETVCLVAIDRDPERRYPTAAAFERDLENALAHRTVEARRASLGLRARRWIERRPGEAAALALSFLIASGVPSLIAWFQSREAQRAGQSLAALQVEQTRTEEQRRIADEQRTRAEANYATALASIDELLREVGETRLDRVPGMVELRAELALAAEQAYRRLLERQPDDSELARLAAGSLRLRAQALAAQGRRAEAKDLLEQALAELEPLSGEGSFDLRRMQVRCVHELASLEDSPVRHAEARELLRALLVERPEDDELRSALVASSWAEVVLEQRAGDQAAAMERMESLESEARDLVNDSPNWATREVLAEMLRKHGQVLWNAGRFEEARPKYEEALELAQSLFDEDPTRDDARAVLTHAAIGLGGLLTRGESSTSLELFERALPHVDWLVANYPGDAMHAHLLAGLHRQRGVALLQLNRLDESVQALEASISLYQSVERRFPEFGSQDFSRGMAGANLASALAGQGDFERALASLDEARQNLLAAFSTTPTDPLRRCWVGIECNMRGYILIKAGRPANAALVLAEAPAFLADRADRLDETLEQMILAVRLAREQGQEAERMKTEDAAQRVFAGASARADAEKLTWLVRLRELLESP